uniref:Uncharacterized protein n=1 Tax=Plectus sambesii TaxID=2011161 RepID=A0A914WUB7_9BILA
MVQYAVISVVLLLSLALLSSAQFFRGNENRDKDGCVVFGNGLCKKIPSVTIRGVPNFGRNGICNGECVNTGRRGADRCECLDIRRGWKRVPAFGWSRVT